LFFHHIILLHTTIINFNFIFVYSSSSYCLDLVRKRDHEHFLATLLLPKEIRPAALAIRAFNVELASVRDSVTDQVLKAFPGKVR
jgi:phytoene/squalene synthetase